MTLKNLRPLGSVVEHSLHTRGVTSSNLVAGTNIFQNLWATQLILASTVLHTFSRTQRLCFFHAESLKSKNVSLSSLMKHVKKDSSLWIKTKGSQFRNFHWQDGYGAFSIAKSDGPELKKCIARQKEHHRKRSFQEELIECLENTASLTTSEKWGSSPTVREGSI